MPDVLPAFSLHPNAALYGVIQQTTIVCDVCGIDREWAYTGPFYSASKPKELSLCPWCIADGRAAQQYHGTFHDTSFDDSASTNSITAVLTRTPGFPTMNPIFWPDHHGQCCVFLGDFIPEEQPKLLELESIREELRRIARELGLAEESLLQSSGSLYILLFQCSVCNTYRLSTDFS